MLSVIIPTDESERVLVPTLACLVPGATAGLIAEVILADGGSRDQTTAIGDVAGCRLLPLPGPLSARLAFAAASARGTWLMFLRPGAILDPNWVGEVSRFIERAQSGGAARAATFRPAADRSALAEAAALFWFAIARRVTPEYGLLIAKQFYDRLGGHRPQAARPEQDLLRRIGRRRMAMLRSHVALGE